MRKLIYFVFPVILTAACDNKGITESLNEIESLTDREQYDSASVALSKINEQTLSDEAEKAHYYLLRKQLGYLTQKPDTTNMLDSLVIPYYSQKNDPEKLANAYYYKSYRSELDGDYPQAILYGKEAERLSQTGNASLKYKILESLAYLNGLCDNNLLQLQYSKNALAVAQEAQNKNWIAYSYNRISFAFANLGQYDSALVYVEKTIPYFDYVYDTDKAEFLTNIGQLYKEEDASKAKEYFEKALTYNELPGTYEHLADVYYDEGKKEEAYRLWKKALTLNSRYEKDNLIHNILTYDLEHGNLDESSKNLDKIIAIKDSMLYLLRNDTIKDLQLRFDHEVAMHKQEKITNNWQKGLLLAFLFMSLLITYIMIKRYREKSRMQEAQMQINDLMNQIRELEKSEKDNAAIHKLNNQIKDAMDKECSLLKQGQMLYDQIKNGQTVCEWRKKEFEMFINYYKAIDYKTVNRLVKTKRKEKLTPQKLFFLLLKEMGYEKKEIARILSIEETSVNTLNTRTKPIE